jgi:hypothetical protein
VGAAVLDEENKEYAHAQLADVDAFLLGRVTYEKFAAAWSQLKLTGTKTFANGVVQFTYVPR